MALTPKEAAAYLKCTPANIRKLRLRGKLKATRKKPPFLFTIAQLDKVKGLKPGRPKKG